MAEIAAHSHMYEEKISARFVLGGALGETIAGIGVIVLSIIGLAGYWQTIMTPVATIALGASLLFEGGAVASRLSDLISETSEGRLGIAELGGGLSAEFIGGLGGITLGVLSLVGVMPMVLTAVAAIVFGSALILGVGMIARLSHLTIGQEENRLARTIAREAVMASTGVQLLVGLGAVVLGILALLNFYPIGLSLVAILSVGGMVILSGTAMGTRMISLFLH